MATPHRVPLYDFPDVVIHAPEAAVKGHPQYRAAKVGDALAAEALVADSLSARAVERLAVVLSGRDVVLVPIHALESEGVNEIPMAPAEELSRRLGGVLPRRRLRWPGRNAGQSGRVRPRAGWGEFWEQRC